MNAIPPEEYRRSLIAALLRYKSHGTRDDEMRRKLNSIQRQLEAEEGVTGVALCDEYAVEE